MLLLVEGGYHLTHGNLTVNQVNYELFTCDHENETMIVYPCSELWSS